MKWKRENWERALTRVDVIVIIAVLAVLVVLLVPALGKARERARRTNCIGHLKQFALGYRQWAIDNTNYLATSLSTNLGGTKEYIASGELFRHFQIMSNELSTTIILVCPSDVRRPAKDFSTLNNTNISYFIGLDADETNPSMFLAGDRNLTNEVPLPPNRIMELTSNSIVGWTAEMHNRQGNIALSDGSVQSFSTGRMLGGLANTGVATNRLATP